MTAPGEPPDAHDHPAATPTPQVDPFDTETPGAPVSWVASLEAIRSPLPPPAVLREYERLVPGCTERFLAMTEKESNYRREMESLVVTSNVEVRARGQIFAFILAMTAVVGGIVLIALDKSAQGLTALISALAGLAGTFLYVRHKANNGDNPKNEDSE